MPRLLVVDDEMSNLELMRRLFDRDYEVLTARNGHEALAHLAETAIDVVLLDIMMPLMNGFQLLEIIRQTPELVDLPVILISALGASDDVAKGLQLGATDYLTKPIDITVARARVEVQLTLKQLSDERKQAIQQLTHANALKARIMQVASHDLKNPLNNLRLLHRVMQKASLDRPRMLELTRRADQTLDAMLQVINGFLDSEFVEHDTFKVQLQAIDADAIVRQVLAQYAIAAHQKDIHIRASNLKGRVIADPERTAQVISNLLSNAIKYSPHHTSIKLFSIQHGGVWRLWVEDEGPGIPPVELKTLFQPFKKTGNKPTGGENSTGLGLWIVKEIMKLQQGAVGVECPPEGGSCFWIELPLVPDEAAV